MDNDEAGGNPHDMALWVHTGGDTADRSCLILRRDTLSAPHTTCRLHPHCRSQVLRWHRTMRSRVMQFSAE
jgi:hypothetical protein